MSGESDQTHTVHSITVNSYPKDRSSHEIVENSSRIINDTLIRNLVRADSLDLGSSVLL